MWPCVTLGYEDVVHAVQLLQASHGKCQIRVPCCSSRGWGASSLNLGWRSGSWVTGDARLKGRSSPKKVKLPLRSERKILVQNVRVCLSGHLKTWSHLSFHLVPIPLPSAVTLFCADTEYLAAHLALSPLLWNSVFPASREADAGFPLRFLGVC